MSSPFSHLTTDGIALTRLAVLMFYLPFGRHIRRYILTPLAKLSTKEKP